MNALRRTGWNRWVALGALVLVAFAASAQEPVDHLAVPGPIRFGDESFQLAWSSHPSAQLYKHEYVPAGQTVERYRSMLMVDLMFDGQTPRQKAEGFAATLEARKASDPVINYQLHPGGNDERVVIDFVLSGAQPDGSIIIEWNAYEYSARGQGVQMLGISRRAYGDEDAKTFLRSLNAARSRDIDALDALDVQATLPAR